jgi:hypothetical protein
MKFNKKEISLIVAALSVMRDDFEFVGCKESAASVDVLINKFLSEV